MYRPNFSAFTLTEVLIVVVILGILAAIVLPVIGKSRESARRVRCQVNLQQLGLAMQQYVEDANRRYPPMATPLSTSKVTWVTGLMPYAKNPELFTCPSGSREESRGATPQTLQDYMWVADASNGWAVEARSHYGLNGLLGLTRPWKIRRPDQKLLIGESSWIEIINYGTPGGEFYDALRHTEGSNVLYCDGHVKWLKIDPGVAALAELANPLIP